MNKFRKSLLSSMLAAGLALAGGIKPVAADIAGHDCTLLSAEFPARHVVKIEAGEFHFKPDQRAPVHTHVAPAIGYIAKGDIIYQVEGREPVLLREGDVFYEPAGPRILRFDNASMSDEAIFVDFNLQQEGEPFIVFEAPLSEPIDRRALPTATLDSPGIEGVAIKAYSVSANKRETLDPDAPLIGYVAKGSARLHMAGEPVKRLATGQSFVLAGGDREAKLATDSSGVTKVIVFSLQRD